MAHRILHTVWRWPHDRCAANVSPGVSQHLVWADELGPTKSLRPQPLDTQIAADVTRRSYVGCADNADVQLYTIHGGGHTWPGGGKMPEWFVGPMSHSVSASNEMWAFFRDHPLR